MMTEDVTRFEVLLENIQTSVKVIAEGHGALTERLDRMDGRFDKLETRFDRLETRFDVFAGDTQRRLKRIEGHLQLNGSSILAQRRKATSAGSPRRRRRS